MFGVLLAGALALGSAPAQQPPAAPGGGQDLESVLSQMDKSAQSFRSAKADLEWDQYTKVVDETDVQKGTAYFQRTDKGMEVAIQITSPTPKQLVYKDGTARLYEPKINQITERKTGKNKADVDAFLSLGFGARGHDLPKSYSVTLEKWETMDNVPTAKLVLVPKSDQLRNMFSSIILWVDPARDVLLKQQFMEASGDYRLTRYTNIKVNANIDSSVFQIKTNDQTRTVQP